VFETVKHNSNLIKNGSDEINEVQRVLKMGQRVYVEFVRESRGAAKDL